MGGIARESAELPKVSITRLWRGIVIKCAGVQIDISRNGLSGVPNEISRDRDVTLCPSKGTFEQISRAYDRRDY